MPILGARTVQQAEENIGCLELTLEPAHLARLDEVSEIEIGYPQRFLASQPLRQALFGKHDASLDRTGKRATATGSHHGIYVVARIKARAGHRDSLEEAFRKSIASVRKKRGCLEYDLVVPAKTGRPGETTFDENEIVLFEKWASLDTFDLHISDPLFREWFDSIRELVADASMQILKAGRST